MVAVADPAFFVFIERVAGVEPGIGCGPVHLHLILK